MTLPGSFWVILLGLLNTLPMTLVAAYPNAIWVPIATDFIFVVVKGIEVYRPKPTEVTPDGAAAAPQLPAERGKGRRFLFG